jgi:hypothetical protein
MGDVIPFDRMQAPKKRPKQSSLCQNNHQKWAIIKEREFDVNQGKLVTVERCERCGKTRNRLT